MALFDLQHAAPSSTPRKGAVTKALLPSMDDSIDILGSSRHSLSLWQSTPLLVRCILCASGLVALYFGSIRAWVFLKIHRDVNYRLAMRRRHGIPDNDKRPFSVAYAAVLRDRPKPEWIKVVQDTLRLPDGVTHSSSPVETRPVEGQASGITSDSRPNPVRVPEEDPYDIFIEHYARRPDVSSQPTHPAPPTIPPAKLKRRKILRFVSPLATRTSRTSKRSFGNDGTDFEEEDEGASKKSRIEDEQSSDPNEHSDVPPGGRKRVMEEDGRGNFTGKRQRKVAVSEDEEMTDEVTELPSIPSTRGKKRDRAEAGSTVGADDDEMLSKRKRRTMFKRKSGSFTADNIRGLKRDRSESIESDGEVDDRTRAKQGKRRGKKTRPSIFADEGASLPMDETFFADGMDRPKRPGDIWISNGVTYKIAADGSLLRQALVKQSRTQSTVPPDSQEPDRVARQDVFLECWLTEKQYKDARERRELAWQDTPPSSRGSSVEPDTLDDPESPTRTRVHTSPDGPRPGSAPGTGKALLWASTVEKSPSPQRTPLRSLAQNSPRPSSVQHRLSATWSPQVSMGITIDPDSPKKEAFKAFSKWERQDMEAEAMRKMRAKLEEEKKAKFAAIKNAAEVKKEVTTAPVAGSSGLATPSMFVEPTKKSPAFALAPPPDATSSAPLASADSSKPAAISPFAPPAPQQPPAPASTKPSPAFTFERPTSTPTQPQAPSTQPTQTGIGQSSTIPNFFAVPSSSAPTASVPTPTATAATPTPLSQPPAWPSTNANRSTAMWTSPSTNGSSDTKPSPFGVPAQGNQAPKSSPFAFNTEAINTKPSPFSAPPPFGQQQQSQQQQNCNNASLFVAQPAATAANASMSTAPTSAPTTAPSHFGLTPLAFGGQPKREEARNVGSSLLNRVGGFAPPAPAPNSSQPTNTSTSMFTFTPLQHQGHMPSMASAPPSGTSSQAGTSGPKFTFQMPKTGTSSTDAPGRISFGDPSKPSTTSAGKSNGQVNGSGNGSSSNKFTFSSTSAPSAPTPFIFGTGSKPKSTLPSFAAFGAGAPLSGPESGSATGGEQPKTAFTFKYSAPSAAGGTFGGNVNSNGTVPSVFGNGQNVTMTNGYQFGAK